MSVDLEKQLERAMKEATRANTELQAIERSRAKRNLAVARIYARSCDDECERIRNLIMAPNARNTDVSDKR